MLHRNKTFFKAKLPRRNGAKRIFNPKPKLGSTPAPGVAGYTLVSSRVAPEWLGRYGIYSCLRGFPRGRGKLRPGRARSPFFDSLITQQFFQLLTRGVLPPRGFVLRDPIPAGEFKILAERAHMFFQHRFGPAFPALLGRARVVMRAIEADAQIRPAFQAGFAPPRLAVQGPRLTTVVAMSGQRHL